MKPHYKALAIGWVFSVILTYVFLDIDRDFKEHRSTLDEYCQQYSWPSIGDKCQDCINRCDNIKGNFLSFTYHSASRGLFGGGGADEEHCFCFINNQSMEI